MLDIFNIFGVSPLTLLFGDEISKTLVSLCIVYHPIIKHNRALTSFNFAFLSVMHLIQLNKEVGGFREYIYKSATFL